MFTIFSSPQRQESIRLNVEMGTYQFISKEKMPEKLVGFVTQNVCECACGYISSDQGYAFFHFFRLDDPDCLAELIKRDFSESTNVKMILMGGNPTNLFLPWKDKKRNLKFIDWDYETESPAEKVGAEALIRLRQGVRDESDYFSKCLVPVQNKNMLFQLISECITTKTKDGLITYDYAVLDKKMSEQKFHVEGFDGFCFFNVASVKDFIGYQNISKLIYAAIKTHLFTGENVSHFNCKIGATLFADFSGNFGVQSREGNVSEELVGVVSDIIGNKPEFSDYSSLNKQDIVPSFRTK